MKEYEKATSEIILPDECDILTSSGKEGTDLPFVDEDDEIVG